MARNSQQLDGLKKQVEQFLQFEERLRKQGCLK
jgi:hypothetical protein